MSVDHGNRGHYLNGGSQIYKREQCPGSLEMEQKFPETQSSKAAEKGTKVHECIEALLPHAIDNFHTPDMWEGMPTLASYDSDEIEAGKAAVEDILSARVLGDLMALSTPLGSSMGWAAERKYVLDDSLELGGSADFSAVYKKGDKKILIIWDYKNGVTPVHARALQLAMYGACAQHELGLEMGEDEPFDEIRCFVYQPNSLNRTEIATRKDYTREELRKITERVKNAARIALGKDKDVEPYLQAGSHCTFCSAKATCPSYSEKIVAECVDVFDDWVSPESSVNPRQAVYQLNDEKVLQAFKNLPYLENYCKAIKEYVKTRYLAQDRIPETKVVTKRGRRSWNSTLPVSKIEKELKDKGLSKVTKKVVKPISEITKIAKEAGMSPQHLNKVLDGLTLRSKDTALPCLEHEYTNYPELQIDQEAVLQDLIDKYLKDGEN